MSTNPIQVGTPRCGVLFAMSRANRPVGRGSCRAASPILVGQRSCEAELPLAASNLFLLITVRKYLSI